MKRREGGGKGEPVTNRIGTIGLNMWTLVTLQGREHLTWIQEKRRGGLIRIQRERGRIGLATSNNARYGRANSSRGDSRHSREVVSGLIFHPSNFCARWHCVSVVSEAPTVWLSATIIRQRR